MLNLLCGNGFGCLRGCGRTPRVTEIVPIRDAARRLGLSESSLRRWISLGRLEAYWVAGPAGWRTVLAVDLVEVAAAGIQPQERRRYRARPRMER
jgi:hypothetical protein